MSDEMSTDVESVEEFQPETQFPNGFSHDPEAAIPEPDENFDLDEWISEAKIPEKSVTLYRRADLIGEMDELDRQIKVRSSDEEESSITDATAAQLKQQWEELAEEFRQSALKFRVRGIKSGDRKEAEKIAKEYQKKNGGGNLQELQGYALLSILIVKPNVSMEQVIKLESALGAGQLGMLIQAYMQASGTIQEPSAPLSRNSSRNQSGGMF